MLRIDLDREDDGRWIAGIRELPGVLAYAATEDEAIRRVKTLALHTLAERVGDGERIPEIDDLFIEKQPATLVVAEPWFFKLRNASAPGIVARISVVVGLAIAFGIVAYFDPGPPFGFGARGMLNGSIFGFGFGLFIAFLLFDLGSLKRTIVVTEEGVLCRSELLWGGGVDDACTGFGNWRRHEIHRLELRSSKTVANPRDVALFVLHPRYGKTAYMGIPAQADLKFIGSVMADMPYPIEVDGTALMARASA